MILTSVQVQRPEGTVVASGVWVQIDQADTYERLDFEGARPFDQYVVFTRQGVPASPLRRRDVLVDEKNTDPETGVAAKYRVVGNVETFGWGAAGTHQECVVERVVGG